MHSPARRRPSHPSDPSPPLPPAADPEPPSASNEVVAPDAICETLRHVPYGGVVSVTWRYSDHRNDPTTWHARVFDAQGRGRRRRWPVEYRLIDEDGDVATSAAILPPGPDVEILRIARVDEMPDRLLHAQRPRESPDRPARHPPADEPLADPAHQPPPDPAREPPINSTQPRPEASEPRPPPDEPPPHEPPPHPATAQAEPPPAQEIPGPMPEAAPADGERLPEEVPTAEDIDDDMDELGAQNVTDNWAQLIETNFRMGHGEPAPPLARMTGRDLVEYLTADESLPAALATCNIAKETARSHRTALNLVTDMPVALFSLPVGRAIAVYYNHIRRVRDWAPQTLAKNLASLSGALKVLPLYRMAAAITINDDPEFASALKGAQKMAREAIPHVPKALSYRQMRRIIQMEPSLPIRAACVIAWSTAARVGDVLKLQTQDIKIERDQLMITWRRGKTIAKVQPYTVITKPPPEWLALISRWTATRHTWLFPSSITTRNICTALRRVDPQYECRSIRRGALQTLAASGVTTKVMLLISGHTSERTLLRYLNWGQLGLNRRNEMTTAALNLFTEARAG